MSKILICIAVYDTAENGRFAYTVETCDGIVKNINRDTTQVVFINNDSCEPTTDHLNRVSKLHSNINVIHNENNIGTAEAINLGIQKYAEEGDFIIKMDNDVVVQEFGWADKMRRCIESNPELGVLGLKRKDLPNSPTSKEYPTELAFAKTELGEPWDVIEYCDDIIGTCQMFNPLLFDKIGYLYQPGLYGFDDVLYCVRSKLSGFKNAFYPSIEIDHIDEGEGGYVEWKRQYAGTQFPMVNGIIEKYRSGEKELYYNPYQQGNEHRF